MSEDLEKLITITLKIEGFSLAFSEDSGEIDPKELLTYIKKLHIPNIKIEAVKKAYGESKGKPYLFAPGLIESQAAAAPAAHFRPTRWLRPPLSPNTPLSMAKTVLIVDSSDNMIKVFKSAFSKAKVKVLFANQPDVFIKMMSSERPDLILLAAKMGKKDSGQLSARIRTSPKHVHVPVIMYSGSRPRQEIIRLFDTGITDYLVMPVNMNSYQSKIQNVLAQVRKTISSGSQVMLKPMAKAPAAATAKPTAKKGEAIEIEAVAPEEQTIQIRDLLKKVTSILAMPHILERVMKISGDSTSGAKELAQAVESDTATVSVVLKKANSAYFGKGEPIKSVQEAIVRIGLNEIKTLVLGLSVVKNFSKEQKSNGFDRMDFWKHSLATAILSKIFAEQVKYNPAEEMFLAGLIHDLGKIILDEHANPPYADIVMNAISNRSPLYNAERETLNFTHVDVGKAIVTHWKFPDSLISAVARHHTPEARQKEKSKPQELLQARLVYIANLLSKALGVGSGGDMSIHELPL
ncbi:MAG: response regulator, partial [Desulfobulbaceae bacterium]|nr:response regulator [Desulfobulbaceae bacterium]